MFLDVSGYAELVSGVYIGFSVFLILFGLILSYFNSPIRATRIELGMSTVIVIALPSILVSFKVLYFGFASGADFGSQEYRSHIVDNMRGVEWLFFKLLALAPAVYYIYSRASGVFSIKSMVFFILCFLLLLSYGGRFLFFISLLSLFLAYLGCYQGDSKKLLLKFTLVSVFAYLFVIFLGAARYAIETDGDLSVNAFADALYRQSAGLPYDFLLSAHLVSPTFAYELIHEKFLVALVPGLVKATDGIKFGAYLATVSGREFEFGHRIGAPGEAFYYLGYLGVLIFSFVFSFGLWLADRLLRSAGDYGVAASLLIFSGLFFSYFIDLSQVLSIFWSIFIVWFIVYVVRIWFKVR
jgi:oligosaccharide repeat unit polymerase